jgi:hypothetical protein
MKRSPLRPALVATIVACCLCVACSGMGSMLDPPSDGRGEAHTPTGQSVTPQAALDTIALGKSTKADLLAALGQAIAIPFDSGYEVWVYRWPGADKTPRAATELVVLFNPAGVATKARVRPGLASLD